MVICLERGANLHMAQLMSLPLTVSCFSKIQIGFAFLVLAHLGSPGKGPLDGCVCVCYLLNMGRWYHSSWQRFCSLLWRDAVDRMHKTCSWSRSVIAHLRSSWWRYRKRSVAGIIDDASIRWSSAVSPCRSTSARSCVLRNINRLLTTSVHLLHWNKQLSSFHYEICLMPLCATSRSDVQVVNKHDGKVTHWAMFWMH